MAKVKLKAQTSTFGYEQVEVDLSNQNMNKF